MPKPILYSSARAPHCLEIALALTEKGVSFERIEVDLPAKQHKTPAFLAINPAGQLPVYVDKDGVVHAETMRILQHLDETFPDVAPKLFPNADEEQSKTVMEWIGVASDRVFKVSHELYWQLIQPPKEGTNESAVAALVSEGRSILERLDATLEAGGSGYVAGGDQPSAADFKLLPWISGYGRYNLPEDPGTVPHVTSWLEKMRERPSFKANFGMIGKPFTE